MEIIFLKNYTLRLYHEVVIERSPGFATGEPWENEKYNLVQTLKGFYKRGL